MTYYDIIHDQLLLNAYDGYNLLAPLSRQKSCMHLKNEWFWMIIYESWKVLDVDSNFDDRWNRNLLSW